MNILYGFIFLLLLNSKIVSAQKIITTDNVSNNIKEFINSKSPKSSDDLKYHSLRNEANPFVSYSNQIIKDSRIKIKDKKMIYSATYHTGVYGIRLTANSETLRSKHIILAGDSNMFGIGVEDDQTLPSRLALKSNTHNIYNLGFAGSGPHNTLYFLENFDLKKIIKEQSLGMFIFDFHFYLTERVIGSKAYFDWATDSPRYELQLDKLVYLGSYRKNWRFWFYKILNKIPFNKILIPNLPRINHSHLELTAKVLAEIKYNYLKQTNKNNKFYVFMNPSFKEDRNTEDEIFLINCLKKEGIEVVSFNKQETLNLPPIIGEVHLGPLAHENYSQMIAKKILSNK
jgi:hypothetical protein